MQRSTAVVFTQTYLTQVGVTYLFVGETRGNLHHYSRLLTVGVGLWGFNGFRFTGRLNVRSTHDQSILSCTRIGGISLGRND